jgi:hypothetical protein
MNEAVVMYRKQTVQSLRCEKQRRKKLSQELDQCLAPLLEECPEPDAKTLNDALGTPEMMATELMAQIPPEEQSQYQTRTRRRKWGVRIFAAVLAVALFAFSVYAIFIKETTVFEVSETLIIYEDISEYEGGEEVEDTISDTSVEDQQP